MALGRKTGGRHAGTPNRSTAEIKEIAQQYGPAAVAVLAQLSGLVKGYPSAESETARIAAVRELLDRGYGKATQPIAGDVGSAPLQVDFRWADPPQPQPEPEAAEAAVNGGFIVAWASDEAG